MRISAIIPVLDEEARIAKRLAEVAAAGLDEVLIVDGGSGDASVARAREWPMARVLRARRGRAFQMNAGAREARGDVLIFLHADVSLPLTARRWIVQALQTKEVVAGAFRTWHVADARPARRAWWLHLADVRSRYTRYPYGDQALFVRERVFRDVGGFPEIPLMEDYELARRLHRVGRVVTVPERVLVSGRRFLAHPVRSAVVVNTFPLLYRLGVSPARLARLYGHVR